MRRVPVGREAVRRDATLGELQRDHLGVGGAVVEAHDAIHADGDHPTRLALEDRCSERSARVVRDVLRRECDRETHAVLVGGIDLIVVHAPDDPAGEREHSLVQRGAVPAHGRLAHERVGERRAAGERSLRGGAAEERTNDVPGAAVRTYHL